MTKENPEFEKAKKEMLGDAYDDLFCKECKTELIECPNCHDSICPNSCDLK